MWFLLSLCLACLFSCSLVCLLVFRINNESVLLDMRTSVMLPVPALEALRWASEIGGRIVGASAVLGHVCVCGRGERERREVFFLSWCAGTSG